MTLNKTIRNANKEIKFGSLAPFLIIALALAARIVPGPRTIDDAFITFRYARNILAGTGFTYNPGEFILGTTTPLYTLLMAWLGSLLGGVNAPFPVIAMVINAFSDAITCLLIWRIGSRLGSPMAGFGTAIIWAIAPFSVTFAIGGMETSVFVLLITAVALSYLEGRYSLCFFLSGLALLARPDALILVGLIGLDRLFFVLRHHPYRVLFVEWGWFCLPVIPWVIYCFYRFGSPLPHSILAKSLAYHLDTNAAFIRLIQHYATPFLENETFGVKAIGVGLVLYLFLSIIGIRKSLKINSRSWPWLLYPWGYFILFSMANPLLFRWYLTPPLPALMLAIFLGTDRIFTGITNQLSKNKDGFRETRWVDSFRWASTSVVILIAFLLTSRGWTLKPDHGLNRPAPKMAWYQLELLYRQVAKDIAPKIHPGDLVAAGDVGVLGYFTNAKILDTVGLNSAISTHYFPLPTDQYVINYAIPCQLVLDELPERVIFLEVYGRNTLLKSAEFNRQYHLENIISTDIYGSHGLLVYLRGTS